MGVRSGLIVTSITEGRICRILNLLTFSAAAYVHFSADITRKPTTRIQVFFK